ncbi:TPA: TerD family protein, partial [Pseudomonas aeruginosa]|nr:TerD family protein [Pseudomonas aeruginosa]
MTTLVPGGNAPVATGQLRVDINYTPIAGADIDISAFALTTAGKVRGDGDMCFYGQPNILGG